MYYIYIIIIIIIYIPFFYFSTSMLSFIAYIFISRFPATIMLHFFIV